LYKKARSGEIKDFTGISSPYEEPIEPEIRIESGAKSIPQKNVEILIKYLTDLKIITTIN
jgi:adenylylsulfate kinase-like enzyme